jgi:hypothetical protein
MNQPSRNNTNENPNPRFPQASPGTDPNGFPTQVKAMFPVLKYTYQKAIDEHKAREASEAKAKARTSAGGTAGSASSGNGVGSGN